MAISSLNGYGVDSYQMQQLLAQAQEKNAAANTTASTAKTSAAATGYSAMETVSSVVELTRAVMEKMGVGKNDRVTFQQINVYRGQLEKEYAEQLKKDFTALGVDPNIKFQLKENDAGGLTVSSDHKDKAIVQKYFDDHPELVEKYKEIQTLANLESARQRMDISPVELKKRLQIENMSAWWNTEGGSSIMSLSSAGTSWFSGVNATV